MAKSKAQIAEEQGYTPFPWGNVEAYQCNRCHFNTTEEDVIKVHVQTGHLAAGASTPAPAADPPSKGGVVTAEVSEDGSVTYSEAGNGKS